MTKLKLTRRGEVVVVVLLLITTVILLAVAAHIGLSRQDHWRCQHGVQEAC